MRFPSSDPGRRGSRSGGFTLIELLVALGLTAILMAGMAALAEVTSRTTRSNDALGTITESLRIGLESLERDIMMAGYTGMGGALSYLDPADACSPIAFLQASDFQLTMIGDYNQSADAGTAQDSPQISFYGTQICTDFDGNCLTCAATLASGAMHAEVVRWSFDWDGDGISRNGSGDLTFSAAAATASAANDFADDADGLTLNPLDLRLVRETSVAGVATGDRVEIAFGMRGRNAAGAFPTDAAGAPRPMFAYWIDDDGDGLIHPVVDGGADHLHGDTNANGVLDPAELPAGPVPRVDLKSIIRVDVFLRAEAARPDPQFALNGGYRFRAARGGAFVPNLAFWYEMAGGS